METNKTTSATECRCPATGELLGVSLVHTEEDVKDAILKARKAQNRWAALPVRTRVRYMQKVRDYLVSHTDDLTRIISRDNGKTRLDALVGEVFSSVIAASYYCRKAEKFLRDKKLSSAHPIVMYKRSKLVRVPWGVVAVISPWNYPFTIPFSEVLTALLAGNTVLLKTAGQTQLVGLALKNCFESAGLPEGVFQYLNIPGQQAGDLLLEGGINKLFFTGSVATGQYLMAKAARTLTPLSLELGGNDPMIVCEDADIDRAVMGAIWGGFTNAGQSCGGVERIFVHEAVYETFIRLLKKKVESLKVGFGMEADSDMGAMTTGTQIKKVEKYVEDALAKGAVLYAQSAIPKDMHNFLPAMVLINVDPKMLVMKEEIFGPVVAVMKVKDMDEAVRLANDSHLGLSASVWSKSNARAERIARRIECGAVNINDHLMSHGLPETPWGGFKMSSIGRTHGAEGFAEMTQPQVIIKDIMPGVKKDIWWPPGNADIYNGVKGITDLWYGSGLRLKLSGLRRLLRVFPRMFRVD